MRMQCRNGHRPGAVGTGQRLPRGGPRRLEQAAAPRAGERKQFFRLSKREGRWRRRTEAGRRTWDGRLRTGWVVSIRRRRAETVGRRLRRGRGLRTEMGDGDDSLTMRARDLRARMRGVDLDGPMAKGALQGNNRHQRTSASGSKEDNQGWQFSAWIAKKKPWRMLFVRREAANRLSRGARLVVREWFSVDVNLVLSC